MGFSPCETPFGFPAFTRASRTAQGYRSSDSTRRVTAQRVARRPFSWKIAPPWTEFANMRAPELPQNARPDSRLATAWAFAELSKEDEPKAEANPHISANSVHDGAICPRKQFAVRDGANRERVLFEQDEVEVEFRISAEANRRLPQKSVVFTACLRMRCDNANFSAKVGV